jgi:cytosine deaminase
MIFSDLSQAEHYWIKNAHVPVALLSHPDLSLTHSQSRDGLVCVDIEIHQGAIAQILPSSPRSDETVPVIDLKQGMVWCGFVDMHTHLDKGHIWERSPNLAHTFDNALQVVKADSEKHWAAEDVYRRMEFGLKCSYAHGTTAIRTHLDSFGEQANISFEVFKALQTEWADRITLQAVALVSLDYWLTPAAEQLADLTAETGGILGGVAYMNDALQAQIDRIFTLAKERNLPLDFHVDETGDLNSIGLRYIADAALRHKFSNSIVCGHCCSLATQPSAEVKKTIDRVKQANIGIVSLPMCNLFLQDRNQTASAPWLQPPDSDSNVALNSSLSLEPFSFPSHTPRWRGVTLLHELKQSGIPVAVASDNCRDPFYGFGDHDGLEVFAQAVRIAQLDAPYADWCRIVTTTPADLIGLPQVGRIGVGLPADLVVFKARYFSELLARPQSDRIVLRRGKPIDTTLPDYAELDDLML